MSKFNKKPVATVVVYPLGTNTPQTITGKVERVRAVKSVAAKTPSLKKTAKTAKTAKAAKTSAPKSVVVQNVAGGLGFSLKEKTELISILLTSFVSDQYYRSADDTQKRVSELVKKIDDKEFIAKAAVYARNEFGMRSISHVVAAEIAKDLSVKGQTWTKAFFKKVVRRVDDMQEILGLIWANGKTPIPNSVKKGFAAAFDSFDTYQLSKYTTENSAIKLVDLVNLVHPVPTDRNRDALNALINGKLKNATTSQRALSSIGQKADSKEEANELRADYFESVLKNNKIGYIDLLRSLTKIGEVCTNEVVDLACNLLTNESAIKKSLVMPFQLYIAMKMVDAHPFNSSIIKRKLVTALAKAVDISCENVPVFSGKTLVVIDRSGSMDSALKDNNAKVISMAETGTLMGLFLAKKNESDIMIFGDSATYVPFNHLDSIITNVSTLMNYNRGGAGKYNVGHGTNFHAIFSNIKGSYDRIIILSDMCGWRTSPYGGFDTKKQLAAYRYNNPKVKLYSYDLAGQGSIQFPEEDVFVIAGFSEKVFDVMKLLEKNKEALVGEIEQIKL